MAVQGVYSELVSALPDNREIYWDFSILGVAFRSSTPIWLTQTASDVYSAGSRREIIRETSEQEQGISGCGYGRKRHESIGIVLPAIFFSAPATVPAKLAWTRFYSTQLIVAKHEYLSVQTLEQTSCSEYRTPPQALTNSEL